jgi:hypothetical protein
MIHNLIIFFWNKPHGRHIDIRVYEVYGAPQSHQKVNSNYNIEPTINVLVNIFK